MLRHEAEGRPLVALRALGVVFSLSGELGSDPVPVTPEQDVDLICTVVVIIPNPIRIGQERIYQSFPSVGVSRRLDELRKGTDAIAHSAFSHIKRPLP